MKKSLVVLDIYQELANGKTVNIKTCKDRYGISESTFYRYLCDIREYLWERNLQEVVYVAQEDTYKIIK
ncbi:MAG: helix-turn-helix domain-containing protein [Clostridia bacterium]|nr:helix-turn-helix domain-containing protein [Clostridia bacterium]